MAYPYFEDVQRAYSELKSEGKIGPRTDQDQIEQDKGLITRRAAYYANQKDSTIGLLEKTSGNNSLGYSVDWNLRSTDGVGWDVVTDDGVQAMPSNGGPYDADPSYIPRWRQPTAELAGIEDGGGETDGGNDDLAQQITDLQEIVNTLVLSVAEQSEMIYHMMTQKWHGECTMGVHMRFGMECPPMPEDEESE